jgi:predicted nucleic acid-binding protein
VARSAGLRVTGTLGVLLKAKRVGLLPSVAEAVADLRTAGMWIADELAENIIAQAGEAQTR